MRSHTSRLCTPRARAPRVDEPYVLYSPHVADMLMGDYGWSPQRYEKWLARMILEAVIRGGKRTRS